MNQFIKKILIVLSSITALLGSASAFIFVKAFGRAKANGENVRTPAVARAQKWFEQQPFEELHIKSYDELNLFGRLLSPALIPDEKAPTIILGIHGYHSDGLGDFAILAPFYQKSGYYLCIPDDRAHGKSDGNYIGFGYYDHFDCISWCSYLIERFGKDCQIFLHGISMGSATVMSCSDDVKLPIQIKGIIADCGYSNGWEQVAHVLKSNFHLPPFPMLYFYNIACRTIGGYNLKEIRPIDCVAHSKVPILFIHGDVDTYVPTAMIYKLYNACSNQKELLIVSGAKHAMSYQTDRFSYEKSVINFIGRCQAKA